MDLPKSNLFSAEEAINYIPRTEKRKKVPVCETLEFSGSLPCSMLPILSRKLKITAYRGLHHPLSQRAPFGSSRSVSGLFVFCAKH